uniref:Poly(A) polymerase catalytic subunit domain-containing protein n=1 Tax=viral metagenome TaxID=1070528 RepID=A0A6C0F183_9ZZZZ
MSKYNTDLCDNDMTFADCELAILRHAVDESDEKKSKRLANAKEITEMIVVVEDFLRKKHLICYGGTAINNILPKQAQFYNRDLEVPDYDFYSPNAMDDAKELADIFHAKGFSEIEAKAGVHYGTFKVFVNFIPIADITLLHPTIFKSMAREAVQIDGILYSPPNFLRMNMYLELSRPEGDVSRWEKIFKRLTLLNEYYPFAITTRCDKIEFQRKMEHDTDKSEELYYTVRDAFIDDGVVFFGGYAARMYSRYMSKDRKEIIQKIPDFDVLSEDPDRCANILIERLKSKGFKNASKKHYPEIGEIVPERIEIVVGKETLAFIYKPIACHNYNVLNIDGKDIKIATIDTMLSFYFAFYYSDEPYYSKDRILCMAKFLFDVEHKNRLEQKGILKRFSINCYGNQPTLESIRAEKMDKFKELKDKRGTREYDMWFLKYSFDKKEPDSEVKNKSEPKKNKNKTKTVRKTIKKRQQRGTRTKLGDFFTRAFRPLKNQ